MRPILRTIALLLAMLASQAVSRAVRADDPSPDAKRRFEMGVEDVRGEAWDRALLDFRASFDLEPTANAESNVAVCLTRLGRFDEAVDTYADLIKRFGATLSPTARRAAEDERARVERFVGGVEVTSDPPGAIVSIEGRVRGTTPLASPLRTGVGTRVVRVTRVGWAPFETTLRVASGEIAQVHATLTIVSEVGRLRVEEAHGETLEVRVDGAPVGATPWDGEVSAGEHVVALRGPNHRGVAPVPVVVEAGHDARLSLAAGILPAAVRVEPTPTVASVRVDGALVAQGTWSGEVPSGPHAIDVTAEWHEPVHLSVQADSDHPQTLRPSLEPVRRIYLEAFYGVTLRPVYAVTGADDCSKSCTGYLTEVRGGYVVAPRVGVEIFFIPQMNNARESNIPNNLTQSDDVFLSGGGFAARYRFFDRWPLTLRMAAGLGRGIAGPPGAGTIFWTPMGGPEVRFGYRFEQGLAVDVGAGAIAVLVPNTVATGIFGGASGTNGGLAVMLPLSAGLHLDF